MKISKIIVSPLWQYYGLIAFAGLISVIFLLSETYLDLFDFWWNISTYNHCILIVPISVYLAYEKRFELFREPPRVSLRGSVFFTLNSVLWLIGGITSIAAIQHAAAIGLVIGMIWSIFGDSRCRVVAFPLLYLYFGLPEGEILVPYLRDLTGDVVVNLLRATNIPVFIEGRYLTIPSGRFHVAKACSGINYLIATLAIGTVFAYTRFKSSWRRLAFMMLAIAVPIIANGIRAYGIVMIAHLSGYKYALGIDHYIYGWVFFGFVIFSLFAFGNLFSDARDETANNGNIRFDWRPLGTLSDRKILYFPIIVTLMCLSAIFVSKNLSSRLTNFDDDVYFLTHKEKAGWVTNSLKEVSVEGRYIGSPVHLKTEYINLKNEDRVELMFTYYVGDAGEIEAGTNVVFDKRAWERIAGPDRVKLKNTSNILEVNQFVIRQGIKKYLVWYWYDTGEKRTADKKSLKFNILSQRFRGKYSGAAIVVATTAIDAEIDHAENVMMNFVREIDPTLINFSQKKVVTETGTSGL